jgi:hypothetical protein
MFFIREEKTKEIILKELKCNLFQNVSMNSLGVEEKRTRQQCES